MFNVKEAYQYFDKVRKEYIKKLWEDYIYDDCHDIRADKVAF